MIEVIAYVFALRNQLISADCGERGDDFYVFKVFPNFNVICENKQNSEED